MISRHTSSVPKDNDLFPRLLYCDSRGSQTCHLRSQVLPGLSSALPCANNVLSGALRCSQICHKHSPGTPVPVTRDPSYSEGRQVWPPRVWYSPEIEASKSSLHILSDTSGVFWWLKYILQMMASKVSTEASVILTFTILIENYCMVASPCTSSPDWFIDCWCLPHIFCCQSMFIT